MQSELWRVPLGPTTLSLSSRDVCAALNGSHMTPRNVCLTRSTTLGNGEAIIYRVIFLSFGCGDVVVWSLWHCSGLELFVELVVITIGGIVAITLRIHCSRDFL